MSQFGTFDSYDKYKSVTKITWNYKPNNLVYSVMLEGAKSELEKLIKMILEKQTG